MAGNSTQPGRTVTSKIISILLAFGEGREHSLTDIARRARLPVSTAHRLAADLTSWQLLERTDDGRYRVGLPLRIIGAADPAPPSVAEGARPSCRIWPPRPSAGPGSECSAEST